MNTRAPLGLLLLALICSTEGAKILGILPTAGKSHYIMGAAYMRILAEAGHEVTVVSPFPLKNPPKNHRDIVLTGMLEKFGIEDHDMFKYGGFGMVNVAIMLMVVYGMFPDRTCDFVLNHDNVKNLLNSDEKFDLVIVETFVSECLYGFAQHFDAPLITFSAFGNSMWTNDLVGTPVPLSHTAHYSVSYTDKMTFWERVMSTVMTAIEYGIYQLYCIPKAKRYYEVGFPNAKLSFEEQLKSVSLVFLNQHFSVSSPKALATNMIEVGGIHVAETKPLPKDLKKFLDDAEEEVIYFCMGTNLKSTNFPVEKREAFVKVFSKLKQKVLWKFEDENLPNQPTNLKIMSWMPQNDILAHPNVKLFITHGGLLGTSEALAHGKPMVGIPIFGDQMMNVEKGVRAGYSLLLDYDDISEATVAKAIKTVLDEPSYAKNAKFISDLYKDRPTSAKETVLYWVDYVIRHKGAPQLRSPAMDLSLWQYHLLDVYAVLAVFLLTAVAINVYVTKKILKKVFQQKPSQDKKKKKRS